MRKIDFKVYENRSFKWQEAFLKKIKTSFFVHKKPSSLQTTWNRQSLFNIRALTQSVYHIKFNRIQNFKQSNDYLNRIHFYVINIFCLSNWKLAMIRKMLSKIKIIDLKK